jgi:hypothetical protein
VDFLHQFFGRAVPKKDKLTAAGSIFAVLHDGKAARPLPASFCDGAAGHCTQNSLALIRVK